MTNETLERWRAALILAGLSETEVNAIIGDLRQ